MSGFDRLLALQELDTRVDQLTYRLDNDPQHAVVAGVEGEVAELVASLEAAEVERFAVSREQKRFEDEALAVEQKVAQVDASLYDGSVAGHKELEALQAEIGHLNDRQAELEDLAIEQMEYGEPLDEALAALAERRAAKEARLEDERRTLTSLLANTEAELDALRSRRSENAEGISAEVIEAYEARRRTGNGQGAARLAPGGSCEGCHLTLSRVDYDTLKHTPEDEMIFCPECDRILVR